MVIEFVLADLKTLVLDRQLESDFNSRPPVLHSIAEMQTETLIFRLEG